jgi:competence protein ComEC
MQSLMILAMLVNREYDPPSALAFAVLAMLAVNPFTIASVGFQLSVASIIGIFLYCSELQQYFMSLGAKPKGKLGKRLKSWVAGSISVTLSAMVTTVPLCAWYFGMVSTVSVLTNLLTLWVVTIVFCGIMFACLLGALWLPSGQGIAWMISWPMRYVLMIADFFSKLPYSAVYTSSVYIVAWLIFCYVLFMVFMRNKKKHPGLFAACIALGLAAAICCTAFETKPEGFAVTVIDVGQGQCVLLQTREEAYLVDCGNTQGEDAADAAIPELLTRGVFRLDGLIMTHYDKDHAAGVNALLDWIPADKLYLPDATPENELRRQIVSENSDSIQWILEEICLEVEEGTLTIYPSSQTDEANESSLCILFQVENYDILITGDRSIAGEEELLAMTDLPELELLVAGHHGSGSSTGLALLTETKPITVVISVGEDNSYGHPHQDALTRLELFGCNVLRTDQMGTITFRR